MAIKDTHGFERYIHDKYVTQLGRKVDFELEVQDTAVEYAVIRYGDEFVDVATGAVLGRFRFHHVFTHPTPPEGMKITAKAYLARGIKDWTPEPGGQWREERTPHDLSDIPSGRATFHIHVYEAAATFRAPADRKYDWDTAKLNLYPRPGKRIPVRRATEHELGFIISPPDESGYWIIRYYPRPQELSPDGPTRADFAVNESQTGLRFTRETLVGPEQDPQE